MLCICDFSFLECVCSVHVYVMSTLCVCVLCLCLLALRFFFGGVPLQVGERPENASAGDSVLSHFVPSRVCQCKAGLPKLAFCFWGLFFGCVSVQSRSKKLALFFVFGFFFLGVS